MTTPNTEVVKKEAMNGGALIEMPTDWGASQITTDRIEMPRIKLMQATSQAVKEERYKAGEAVNGTSNLVVGGRGKPFGVIIFNEASFWTVYEKDKNGKSTFKEKFPMTAQNLDLKKEEGNLKRVKVNEFYCLPADDYESGVPWIIPFAGSSFKHAKKLLTNIRTSKASYGSFVQLLDTVVEVWDGNSYYVYSVKRGEKTTREQELAAYALFKDSRKSKEMAEASLSEADDETVHF